MNIIKEIEQEQMKNKIPFFQSGDTIKVNIWVVEGTKKRTQAFEGIVIAKRNRNFNSSFCIRKISNGEGIERTFSTYSPIIENITVQRYGDVRKSKLYYLRSRTGKLAKIKELLKSKKLQK